MSISQNVYNCTCKCAAPVCITVPVNVQRQTVGLPAHSGGVGLQQEAAEELDERLLVGKLVQLADQSHAELVLLAAHPLAWNKTAPRTPFI